MTVVEAVGGSDAGGGGGWTVVTMVGYDDGSNGCGWRQ